MDYTGIKVKNNTSPATTINALKIASGAHDIFTIASGSGNMQDPDASPAADVVLISVTVDVANKVVSGYDANGNRYIVDKQADILLTLV